MSGIVDFQPDWVSPPGITISRILQQKGMSEKKLATLLGASEIYIRELIDGKNSISESVAEALSENIGATYDFWMSREVHYRTRLKVSQNEKYQDELKEWVKALPVSDLRRFGWIEMPNESIEKAKKCLKFFGVSDVGEWNKRYGSSISLAAFRSSDAFEPHIGAVASWIRQGELKGKKMNCASWNKDLFVGMLREIRELTRVKDPRVFLSILREKCAQCGVAVVIAPTPSGCRASGATKFLNNNKALMLLSFRYLSDDQFWFTFFHEAAHLILHGKDAFFLETKSVERNISEEEKEANNFSADILVPLKYREELCNLKLDKRSIIKFANNLGVSPGIIVGQLQFYGRVNYKRLNGFKRRYNWEVIH